MLLTVGKNHVGEFLYFELSSQSSEFETTFNPDLGGLLTPYDTRRSGWQRWVRSRQWGVHEAPTRSGRAGRRVRAASFVGVAMPTP